MPTGGSNQEPLPPLEKSFPEWIVPAIVTELGKVDDGAIIELIKPAWRALLARLSESPELRYELPWRKLEEVVAAGYDAAGFQVVLTPRSGDRGRDVIATLQGVAQVRIVESVKALGQGKMVPRRDVDELLGVLSRSDASKAVLTTTASFAPDIANISEIQRLIPTKLQLVDGTQLVPRLLEMSGGDPFKTNA